MEVPVYNMQGAQVAQLKIDEAALGGKVNPALVKQAYVMYHANVRQGSSKTKNRHEVEGSTKKMYKQKGTGGARHGSRRAAQFVGGAKAHGPVVRSHAFDLPKKVRALALRHALSSKARSGDLMVVDSLALTEAKTAALRTTLGKIGLVNALVIAGPEVDGNFRLAARNIPNVDVLPNAGLNVYDVLRRRTLVLTKDAVEAINARFAEKEAA